MIHTIASRGGTTIAYEERGSGPPLILVHGGLVDRTFWRPAIPFLARRFAVYALDRRGHGDERPIRCQSQDGTRYDDLAALIEAISAPITVLGHSSGALVAP
jgi:pimeloyl-ACP methyl ester carboxylesterase